MFDFALLGYAIVVGVLVGVYYAFMALGLNLVFGVVRMVNISHGNIMVLGAYLAFYFFSGLSVSPLVSFVAAAPLFFGVGMVIYVAMVPRLHRAKDPETNSFIAFFGLALFIEAASFTAFGADYHSLPTSALLGGSVRLFGFSVSDATMVISLLSAAMVFVTYLYLKRTKLGKGTQALIQNEEQAVSFGVNPNTVSLVAFSYGFALAGMAGVMSPYIFGYIYPSLGDLITIISFAIVIIGALGDPLSSIVGGLAYGVLIELLNAYLPGLSNAVTFVVLVVVIVLRPGGLLGRTQREV